MVTLHSLPTWPPAEVKAAGHCAPVPPTGVQTTEQPGSQGSDGAVSASGQSHCTPSRGKQGSQARRVTAPL